MSSHRFSIHQLGWRACQAEQLTADDFECRFPARVACVHRGALFALSERGEVALDAPRGEQIAVGDWILLEAVTQRFARLLDRVTSLSRMAAGIEARTQLVAANVDVTFLVTSCNRDFNASRLERYLALARQGRTEPVVVLTKADQASRSSAFVEEIARIAPGVQALPIDARDPECASALRPWLQHGSTVAVLGSSGVGKSTLTSTLTGVELATNTVREADSKGRHTTTSRHMFAVPNGGWIIDTPGMRELRLGDDSEGVRATFADIEQLARRCRFRDCSHRGDAGCAVAAEIEIGLLEQRRLESYLKLQREALHSAQTLQERRATDRRLGKMHKSIIERRRSERKGS